MQKKVKKITKISKKDIHRKPKNDNIKVRQLHIKRGPDFPTFARLYAQELEVPWNPNDFKGQPIPAKLAIVRKMVEAAVNGNHRIAKQIEDRLEGMPVQPQLQMGDEKRSLRIVIDHRKDGEKAPNEEGDDGKKDEETP